jgi:prolyl-tRNA synthetase
MANELGVGVKKEEDLSKWYTEVIQKADLADYSDVSGCMVFKPDSYAMWEIIQQATDKKFKELGIRNAYFPLFIPEKFLIKEEEHVKGFSPEVAWVTHAGDTLLNERLAVRPTSETIMYPFYSKWIRSWRDLPLKINQWNNVVRWEFKHPVPFMRTREFLWNEGHTVYATKEDAESERDPILNIYLNILKDYMCLYGVAGKKSEKEKFAGAVYTCSIELFLPSGKAIQGPDFHYDGQNFAKAFDIQYLDKDGNKQYAFQNTFAITTRMIGVMIMMHGDDKGLVLPPKIAPTQVVIIPIYKKESKEQVLKECKKIKEHLSDFRVFVDEEDLTPGRKFNMYEMKGVPVRVEIGPRDLENKQAVVARRDNGEKKTVKIADLKKEIEKQFESISKSLYERSRKQFEDNVVKVKDMDELIKVINEKKMAYAPFCNEGDCEDYIKEKTGGATTRNIPFDSKKPKGKCIQCDKPANVMIYIAKSY